LCIGRDAVGWYFAPLPRRLVGHRRRHRFIATATSPRVLVDEPCRTVFAGWLYVIFQGAFDGAAYWDNNDAVWLGRVPEAHIANASVYTYFAGFNGGGDSGTTPLWGGRPTAGAAGLRLPAHNRRELRDVARGAGPLCHGQRRLDRR